jgi:hypothetical protein
MIQILKYKCCGKIFAACSEPECYTDKEWLKGLKQYVNRGDKVEMIEKGTGFKFGKCECKEEKSSNLSIQFAEWLSENE